jgi:cytochrome d ubiquinol oxidase subunit I
MELDPLFLSRVQFAFVISFHIIFPAFTIGLAAWLATIEGARLVTGNALYRRVFDFCSGPIIRHGSRHPHRDGLSVRH